MRVKGVIRVRKLMRAKVFRAKIIVRVRGIM